ncbi:MYB-like transcription factor ETC1 isoform X1 [Populus alba x Populus x berolinensis]|nr:MYB-like transcription factor ETC1 isoform X1 [Populus alba x Populus x berolinensis]
MADSEHSSSDETFAYSRGTVLLTLTFVVSSSLPTQLVGKNINGILSLLSFVTFCCLYLKCLFTTRAGVSLLDYLLNTMFGFIDFGMFCSEETSQESRLEFSEDEETLIIRMFNLVGERWSLIAGRIPGRTAEEIEKYWNTRYSTSE